MIHLHEQLPELPVQTQFVSQTIDDYLADQWLWARQGMVVQNNRLVLRIYAAQIAPNEPIIDLRVVDMGPCRYVRIQALVESDDGGAKLGPYRPEAIYPPDEYNPDSFDHELRKLHHGQ